MKMRLLESTGCFFIASSVIVTISNGMTDEILHKDFLAILRRWDLHFISIVRSQPSEPLQSIEKQARSSEFLIDCMKHNLRVNTIRIGNISIKTLKGSAIFYEMSTPPPRNDLHEMIAWSRSSRPLFLCSLRDASLPGWLRNTRVPFTSSVYVILRDAQQPETLTLQGLYHLHEESDQLTVDLVGRRTRQGQTSRWTFFGPKVDVLRRADLQGLVIRTIFPAVLYMPDTKGMKKLFENVRSVATVTVEALNASIEPVVVYEANIVGSRDAAGAWSGSIGMLQRLEADLSAVMFSASPETEAVVDASHPYLYAKNFFFIRKPTFEFSLRSTLEGFSAEVWLASSLALLTLAAALSLINYVKPNNKIGFGKALDFSRSILEVLGDLCVQGWSHIPTSKSGHVIVVVSILLGYLLNLLYVNQLTAGLAADNAPLPFRTMEEMVEVKTHLPMVFRASWTHVAAQVATEGPYKLLNELLIKHGPNAYFNDARTAMELICQEKVVTQVVMFIWDINVRPLLSKMNCTIVSTNVGMLARYLSMGARKHYPYLPQINYFLRRIAEGGIVQRFLKHFEMDEVAQGGFKEIEFSNVVPFLLLYGTALATSVIVFVCEVSYSRLSKCMYLERRVFT